MAEGASKERNSLGTVKSKAFPRRNSLPLFSSDFGKDVPSYLRASNGSCHDHCKYGRRDAVVDKQPVFKRQAVVPKFKAIDKPKSVQHDCSKIRNPTILSDYKTPDSTSKQSATRWKDTKTSDGNPKSGKSKLPKETSVTRKLVGTLGSEKLKRQREIVPVSGNLSDSKTNDKSVDGGKLIKSTKGPSTNAASKQNAKAKPSVLPIPTRITPKVKPVSSLSPRCARPMIKARPHSSPPTKLKAVSLKPNFVSSPGSLKLKHATGKASISSPSVSLRNVPNRKVIDTRSQIVKKEKIPMERAAEVVAILEVTDNKDFQLEKQVQNGEDLNNETELIDQEATENVESFENIDEDSSHEIELQNQEKATESGEMFKQIEGDSSHESEIQNEEATESYDDQILEKTLYVIDIETENKIQPTTNAEDQIPDLQLTSLSPPQSPSSPISITVVNISTQHETILNELSNLDTDLPYANQETPDMQPLPSLSPAISPKSQSSIVASNELSHYEVSLDGSVYSESDEGYSSYEDDTIIEGENENPKGSNNSKLKKSARVISQEGKEDPVKLRFRRGRVIDVTDEHHGPRRLKFRRAKVRDEKTAKDFVSKSSFKKAEPTQVKAATDGNISGSVVLRHQDIEEKDAQGLLNNVIEETASKLVEKRKSMVKALVGAFETVISLQDGKPATSKHDE